MNSTKPAKEKCEDSWGSIGLDETPQCDSAKRLVSRPRKAKHFSAAMVKIYPYIPLKYSGYHSSFMLNVLVMSQPLLLMMIPPIMLVLPVQIMQCRDK